MQDSEVGTEFDNGTEMWNRVPECGVEFQSEVE